MKNTIPKTLRKRPKRLYEIRPERGRWEVFLNGTSQGFHARHSGAIAIALRYAQSDADLGMKVIVETVQPDGSKKIDWQEI